MSDQPSERARKLCEALGAHILPPRLYEAEECFHCVAIQAALDEEREGCARVAEEHLDHIDVAAVQDHEEPPFRCCVARAIRSRSRA